MPHSHLANSYEYVRTLVEAEASVRLYQHLPSHDLVVIKTFATSASSLEALAPSEMAARELVANQVLAQHPHDNIVRLRDHFFEAGHVHLVFDYCRGGDLLSTLLASPAAPAWSDNDAVAMFRQIAKGLAHAHAHDVAHLDLSLENILVDGKTVRLGDFGLAAVGAPTRYGGVGKLYYMAPEMHLRRAYNVQAADRWALGIVLFLLLTGRPAFEEATLRDVNYKIFFHAQATAADDGVAALCRELKIQLAGPGLDLVTKLLNPSPMKRLSMDDVLAHPFLHPVAPPKLANLRKRSASQPALMSAVHIRSSFKPMAQISMTYLNTLSTV